jgi:uncharacterized protein YukE
MTSDELAAAKETLQKAIYSGMLEVRFGDRWIRYQSTSDMQKALSDINNEISNVAASATSSTRRGMCNFTQFNG